MENKQIPFTEQRIESTLSQIGAKVVKATESAFLATKLLQEVQTDIAELYESLGDND